jgi:hypothetical protein
MSGAEDNPSVEMVRKEIEWGWREADGRAKPFTTTEFGSALDPTGAAAKKVAFLIVDNGDEGG